MKFSRAALFFSLFVFAVSTQAAPRAEDLLRATMAAEKKVSYSATETTVRVGAPMIVARVQKSGGKQRLEYSRPAIMRGDILLRDGTNIWRYYRAEKSAIKTKMAAREGRDWETMRRRMTAKIQSRVVFAGRSAWIVAIYSREKKKLVRRIWIDDKTKIRLRVERFDDAGKKVETRALSNLKFAAIPAAIFRWTPPRGTEISNAGTLYQRLDQAKQKAAWLRVPYQLPRGFAFESAVINSQDAWLRYSNSARRFSIFQQRTKDNSNKPIKPAGLGWYWQKGGSRFILAGLPKGQAELVAASVR